MTDHIGPEEFEKMLRHHITYEDKIRENAQRFTKEQRIGLCNAFRESLDEELNKPLAEQNGIFVNEWPKIIETLENPQNGIKVTISESDGVFGFIHNGQDGVVKRIVIREAKGTERRIETDVVRFIGKIGPVIMIDGEMPGIKINLNGIVDVFEVRDALAFFRSEFAIPQNKMQNLGEILRSYVSQEVSKGNFEQYASSPITVVNNIIRVNSEKRHELGSILLSIRNFHPEASHREAFVSFFSWALLAPLHDELKRRSAKGIQTPIVMLSGKTRAGKTTLGNLYIGKGYDLQQDEYFYPYNRVYTRFALMKHLGESNLPALFDDLLGDWILKHKEDLKSYVQTGHFGDRGRGDQTLTEYKGRRSFAGTINDDIRIDDDFALSLRLLILWFKESHRQRKNKAKFDAMFETLPDGFMYDIFRAIFEGKNINDVLREVERFDDVEDWINYGIGRINELLRKHNLEGFPRFFDDEDSTQVSNAQAVAQAFIAENDRIEASRETKTDHGTGEPITRQRYNSPIEQAFKIERKDGRIYIYFTGPAFKTLNNRLQLQLPHRNASDFLNNVKSSDSSVRVENSGAAITKRLGGSVLKAYCVSIKEEVDPNERWN